MTDWAERAAAVGESELAGFRLGICVAPGHPGTADIGRCSRCGGPTSSGTMRFCAACGVELGVCQYDGRATGWGAASGGDPGRAAARWLALLMRGYSAERDAAERALGTFALPGLAEVAGAVRDTAPPGHSPVTAELIVGLAGAPPEGMQAGGDLLGAPVVSVNPVLRSAVVRPSDARAFEARAQSDPLVAFVSLNRQAAELGGGGE